MCQLSVHYNPLWRNTAYTTGREKRNVTLMCLVVYRAFSPSHAYTSTLEGKIETNDIQYMS